jgi:hypothetical protein
MHLARSLITKTSFNTQKGRMDKLPLHYKELLTKWGKKANDPNDQDRE